LHYQTGNVQHAFGDQQKHAAATPKRAPDGPLALFSPNQKEKK
jgi:hypothetical protein